MINYYKLDENKNVVPSSCKEWADFIEGKPPHNYMYVDRTIIDGHCVSTIFSGICFNLFNNIPIVFETMVFDKDDIPLDYEARYSTYKEAEEGHQKAVEWVKNGCKEDE